MKKHLFFLTLTISFFVSSQDLITFKNGTRLECEIIKSDSINVHYRFNKNDRAIETFTSLNDISAYEYNYKREVEQKNILQNEKVIVDTTRYVKEKSRWVNLITFAPALGINAKGWTLQYRGFQLNSLRKWSIPISFTLESLELREELLYRAGYTGIKMDYGQAGISPIKRLNDYIYLNLGINLLFGSEHLVSNNYNNTQSSLFGLSTLQGLLIFPPSGFGFCVGISTYQKLLNSSVYSHDIGIKLDLGIEF